MEEQAPVHRVAGIDILGNREIHEVIRSDDRNLPGPHIRFVDNTANATPVVAMRMRINHGRNRQALDRHAAETTSRQRARVPWTHQRIEHDPAGLAANKGDVGEIEAAHLVDAGDHLVEAVVVVQFGLTKKRGMDAVEIILLVQKLKPLHVPGDMAGIRHDLEVFHGGDKPLLILLEIPRVREWQAFARLLEDLQREFRRRFALGMEMPLQWRRRLRLRLRVCRTIVQDHLPSDRKGRSDCGKRLHEFAACRHRRLHIARFSKTNRAYMASLLPSRSPRSA